jgi:hypothetical protein
MHLFLQKLVFRRYELVRLGFNPVLGANPAILPNIAPLLVRELIAEILLGPLKTILFYYIYAKYKKYVKILYYILFLYIYKVK